MNPTQKHRELFFRLTHPLLTEENGAAILAGFEAGCLAIAQEKIRAMEIFIAGQKEELDLARGQLREWEVSAAKCAAEIKEG